MKLRSWNVNGIRACIRNGFHDWLAEDQADIICLQETKARPDNVSESDRYPDGYQSFWHSAARAGYSSVATYTRIPPKAVTYGLGIEEFDSEGRVLTLHFDSFDLVNAYFPNSQRDHARLPYKLRFCDAIFERVDACIRTGRSVVLCGDFNIAHREIDLKNPKTNRNNAGFLPEERDWMSRFLDNGCIDTFRHKHGDVEDQYTWWSYRPGVRDRNIGWRLDYFVTSPDLADQISHAGIQQNVKGSDHCPVTLDLNVRA
jgi:exodeoxyribonuclease-3